MNCSHCNISFGVTNRYSILVHCKQSSGAAHELYTGMQQFLPESDINGVGSALKLDLVLCIDCKSCLFEFDLTDTYIYCGRVREYIGGLVADYIESVLPKINRKLLDTILKDTVVFSMCDSVVDTIPSNSFFIKKQVSQKIGLITRTHPIRQCDPLKTISEVAAI